MKTCFKCGIAKPRSEFYRHAMTGDGLLGKCKDCTKKDVHQRYIEHKEKCQEYERVRNKSPTRKAQKLRYAKNRRKKHPEKEVAHRKVAYAVRNGTLKKTPCIHCGDPKVEGHHRDYFKPLDVVWVCRKCHRTIEHGIDATKRTF